MYIRVSRLQDDATCEEYLSKDEEGSLKFKSNEVRSERCDHKRKVCTLLYFGD